MIMDEKKFIANANIALQTAEQGLPDDIFNFVASVVPLVNVDLLIENKKHQILLAWRDDGKNLGWHIPGGIIRFKESFYERIQKTALRELGSRVIVDEYPLKISEIILPYQCRGHAVSLLYRCYLPDEYHIDNQKLLPTSDGYLQWHNFLPSLVNGQKCYESFLKNYLAIDK